MQKSTDHFIFICEKFRAQRIQFLGADMIQPLCSSVLFVEGAQKVLQFTNSTKIFNASRINIINTL